MKKDSRKEKLSIYFARYSFRSDDELIKVENAKEPIDLKIPGTEQSTLYIKKPSANKPPLWSILLCESGEVTADDFGVSNSVGAVLIVRLEDQAFILSFGFGFHLINNDEVERDFGFRVTLNSVHPEKLRSLDKSSFFDHNPLNSRTQSTQEVDIFQLHVDSEQEMLYAVTGISQEELLGTTVTGRDALTLVLSTSLSKIPKILHKAFEKYRSELPEKFKWVDKISRVRDAEDNKLLDMELDTVLENEETLKLWLGEPEVVNWESQVGYSFDMNKKTPRHVVLKISDLFDYLNEKGKEICVEVLKRTYVYVNNSEYQVTKKWSAYRCLYAEIDVASTYYVLRNGIWYQIEKEFEKEVDRYLERLSVHDYVFPTYNHENEKNYNIDVSNSSDSFELMDVKPIRIGGPYDKIEFCDLVRNGRELIHVKFYRSSSTLSHLFSQGLVAAETFIKDEGFRERLNGELPESIKLDDPQKRPSPSDYTIVYAIATKKDLPQKLPFFSKVTLKAALKTLLALNYRVAINRIDVDEMFLVKSKIKSEEKK